MASSTYGADPTTNSSSLMLSIPISNSNSKTTTTSLATTTTTTTSPSRATVSGQQVQQPQILQHLQIQQRHQQLQQPNQPATNQPQQHQHQLGGSFATQTPSVQVQTQNPSRPQSGIVSEPVIYPLASSGRGLLSAPTPRSIRPQFPDQNVTVVNSCAYPRSTVAAAAAYPPPSALPPAQVQHQHTRHLSPSDSLQPPHSSHLIRSPYLYPSRAHMPSVSVSHAPFIKGISLNPRAQSKVASSPCSAPDSNGHKLPLDKCGEDTVVTIRDRNVRISDGDSIYALCRSWLRNGYQEERQPLYGEFMKSLPKTPPMPMSESSPPKRKESDDETEAEEVENSVDNMHPKELLQRHIKRAKRVRARLREERLQRIERYKSRLALLLPPLMEQCRNEAT